MCHLSIILSLLLLLPLLLTDDDDGDDGMPRAAPSLSLSLSFYSRSVRLRIEIVLDIKMLNDFRYKQPYEMPIPNEPPSTPIEDSWIYTFCIKCRGKDATPSWEPPMWQKFCPFPLCPTFRQFSRLWCIIIIG